MKIDFHKTNWSHLSARMVVLTLASLMIGTFIVADTHKPGYDPNSRSVGRALNKAQMVNAVGRLPLAFEPNRGQADPRVKYLARAQGYTAFLAGDEIVFLVKGAGRNSVLTMSFPQASATSRVTASDMQVGRTNYVIGNDRSKWLTSVPNYGKVTYEEVYRGVDVVYSGNQRDLEYDFVVKPGADPNQIRVAYSGQFKLNAQGDLEIATDAGVTVAHKPVVYQTVHGQRKVVQGAYVPTATNEARFELGAYDRSIALVIDPVYTVGAFIGGNSSDTANGVAANSAGVYLTGSTTSAGSTDLNATGFPLTPPTCPGTGSQAAPCATGAPLPATILKSTVGTSRSVFVTALSPDATTLIYSTFLGGTTGPDIGNAIAVDATGAVYVTGSASEGFPTTNRSAQNGSTDVFISKLSPNGQTLVYSVLFGGPNADQGNAIAVDGSGNAYVGGQTASSGIGMASPLSIQATPCSSGNVSNCSSAFMGATYGGGTSDGVVMKFNSAGAIVFSTYLGGSGADIIKGLALDSSGNIYITGSSTSFGASPINAPTNFPTTNSGSIGTGTASNTMATNVSGTNAFVAKINANLTTIAYSDTFGDGRDQANAIAVDSNGLAYVAAQNGSAFAPTYLQIGATADSMGHVATLPTGTVNDANGVCPYTAPTIGTAMVTAPSCSNLLSNGAAQGFVIALTAAGNTTSYINYIATESTLSTVPASTLTGVALDSSGNAYVVGTESDGTFNFLFLARLNPAGVAGSVPVPGSVDFQGNLASPNAPPTFGAQGNGIALSTSGTVRTAFLAGATDASGALVGTPTRQNFGGFPGGPDVSPIQPDLLNGPNTSSFSSIKTIGSRRQGGNTSAAAFAAVTFYDLLASPNSVTFSSMGTPGTAGVNQAQTIAVTNIDGSIPVCPLAVGSTSGSFFTNGGSVALASGATNQFTVQTGTQNIPALGTSVTGTFTVVNPGGCALAEPLMVGVTYTSSTAYSVTSTGVNISTPVGTTSGLPFEASAYPTITVTAPTSIMTNAVVSTPAASTGWVTPFGCATPPFTLSTSNPFSVGATPTTITVTPSSFCLLGQTTPGTYAGTITISPVTAGAAASVVVPYTITLTPSFQSCPTPTTCFSAGGTVTFNFSALSTAPQQQTVSLFGNGAAFTYNAQIIPNGSTNAALANTFPSGALTISSGANGTVGNGGTALIGLQVNPTSLAVGQYQAAMYASSGSQALYFTVIANIGSALLPQFGTSSSQFLAQPVAPSGISVSLPTGLGSTGVGYLFINGTSNLNVSSPAITYTSGTGWLADAATNCNGTITPPPNLLSGTTGTACANALSVNTSALMPGNYSATIGFTSTTTGVAALNIPVNLTVTSGPILEQVFSTIVEPTPIPLFFSQAPNQAPPAATTQTLNIQANAGTVSNATLTASTNTGGSWLQFCPSQCSNSPITGQTITGTASSFMIGVNTANLIPTKLYTGNITVSAPGSASLVIPVTLAILPPHGSSPGVFRGSNGLWLLDTNANNAYDQGIDEVTSFSGNGLTPQAGDIAVVGDWNGNGITKIGLYRPSTGTWFLDYNGNGVFDGPILDRQYQYGGIAGDIPVTGDWNDSGASKIGIFRGGFEWLLNLSGNGIFSGGSNDAVFAFGGLTGCTSGLPGIYSVEPAGSCDIPVVGDWDGDGTSKAGIVRASPGTSQPFLWILDTTGARAYVASGDSASEVFPFGGIPGDVPIVGDWVNFGVSFFTGVVRSGFLWIEQIPGQPIVFPFGGVPGDQPVVGHWR